MAFTITPVAANIATYLAPRFLQGQSAIDWNITTSSGLRFLPGGEALPQNPNQLSIGTYAFSITSGQGYVVIHASTPVSPRDFLSFRVYILAWNDISWSNVTLFGDSSLATVHEDGLDGTNSNDFGYVSVSSTTPVFYAVEVGYVLAPSPPDRTTTFVIEYVPSLTPP